MRCVVRNGWRAFRRLLALLLAAACLAPALAAARALPPMGLLVDAQAPMDAQQLGVAWVDPSGSATLEQVLKSNAAFKPAQKDLIYSLGEHGVLWLHYRLQRGRNDEHRWLMAFPMPALDSVTVYQRNAKGEWLAQTAGDTIAVSLWAEPGRYPHFRLDLPGEQVSDVYVRIRHFTSANFPLQLLTEGVHEQRIQLEYLGLGLTFGALMLLIATCLAQSLVYRDGVYAGYAGYALVTALAVAAYTGAAAHLLWPGFAGLGDSPQGGLAMLGSAAAVLFVRNLTGISARHPLVDRMTYWGGLAGIGLAAVFLLLDKGTGLALLALYVAGTSLTNVWIASAAWRRGDAVGAWVLVAYAPFALAVCLAIVRLFGWLPVSFGTQYAVVAALALQVPLLLVALNIRSRERHGVEIRELALSSQDALTGLLASHLFHDRLRQVVARHKRHKENAAVVFIELVNHPRIKAQYGAAVAEQSLLRCVIKLRRLLRDVDTVSRIGEARFGLILEGVSSRAAVTDRAARLIAAGLMPLQGLKPDVTLQFHVAAVLLQERLGEADEITRALGDLLRQMSPRTRRPIRFLEPEVTLPAAVETDSSLLDIDSVPPPPPPVAQTAAPAPAPALAADVSRSASRR